MSNMSYCRFQNTLKDLRDCESAMMDVANHDCPLSREEDIARKQIIRLCIEIARDYGDEIGWDVDARQVRKT